MTRTAETVQEQQQESEIEQFNKQLREQINQTKILGEENIGNAIEPYPSLTVCNLNPEKKCLSLVRASNDWRNTYSESDEAPFEQGKIPIFLAKRHRVGIFKWCRSRSHFTGRGRKSIF